MTTHYMILCHARTGSNYLVNALAHHPAIEAHNELFHENTIYSAHEHIKDADTIAKRDADPVAYLQTIMAKATKPVWGFKHLLFYHEVIIDYVINNAFKVILLERENILAQYSSFGIAHQTGQWTLHPGAQPVRAEKLVWDEAKFDDYRHEYTAAYETLKERLNQREHTLTYTDLFVPEKLAQVFEFLGLNDARPVDAEYIRKQNTSHITERFDQPEVVRAYLARIGHTDWETEFSE